MSLIVGTIEGGEIIISADTKLTPGTTWAVDEPTNGLKLFFLDRDTCIAYAGIRVAQDLICECARLSSTASLVDRIASLVEARQQIQKKMQLSSEQAPDFLIGSVKGGPELYRICGTAEPSKIESRTWIGDAKAATAFLKLLASSSEGSLPSVWQSDAISSFPKCLREVIGSGKHESVGGYPVTARGRATGFSFQAEMCLVSPYYTPVADDSPHAVDFGTAETGGFGYVSVVPCEPGRNGYGLYFFQGRFGIFYFPDLQQNRFERLRGWASTARGFAELVARDVGYPIEAFGELGTPKG